MTHTKWETPAALGGGATLLAKVSESADTRLCAAVSGATGSGKTALLDDLGARYRAAGLRVSRSLREFAAVGGPSGALLIDDAHALGAAELEDIGALLDDSAPSIVVAYRPWPHSPQLLRLATELERYHEPVVLGPLSRDEIDAELARALSAPAPEGLVDEVARLTGGIRWLVRRLAEDARPGGVDSAIVAISPETAGRLGHVLGSLSTEVRELLLAIAVGFDLSATVPSALAALGDGIHPLVAEAVASGLLLPDGRHVPLLRTALLEATPGYQIRMLQRSLVDTILAGDRPLGELASVLAQDGMRDARVARTLEHAADDILLSQPALASKLYGDASAAGGDHLSTAARRAQAASAAGDLTAAGRILDDLLSHEEAPDLSRAVDAAAGMWAQRGMLARSSEVYSWLGRGRVGSSAPLAAVAMIGVGDREGADGMLAAWAPTGSPTLLAVAHSLMGSGIRASVDGDFAQALSLLVRASDTMTATGAKVTLPDSPAALAALVAIHNGELDVAFSVLESALRGGQCGAAARPRMMLLTAWASMLAGQPDRARATIMEVLDGEPDLALRDELLLCSMEVGLARRTDDAQALLRSWQRARSLLLHVSFDLYSLLPLGELVIAAARVRDSAWIESHLSAAWELLGRMGDPAVWSSSLHWACVQAGILNDRPLDLAPHAAALVRSSSRSRLASVLSVAGREWVSVLSGDFDVAAVDSAARGLGSVGLAWDGSRLAGHAAARSVERKDMARLLACARDLQPSEPVSTMDATPTTIVAADSVLTARESEVAKLVLEGKTYREIGDAIFVSPRTAEHHIAQIRRRLGATTRSELLTMLREVLAPRERSVN